MRYKHLYISQALGVLARHAESLGYDDSWLLEVASEAATVRDWELVRGCLATFAWERTFGKVEEKAIEHLSRLVSDEIIASFSDTTYDEYVELQEGVEEVEELPL